MAQIKISQLTTGTPKGTDETPAVDTTDTTQAASGTTKKYIRSDELNYYLHAQGLTTYAATRVATTGALTVVYANGTLGVGATLTNAGAQAALAIDGVTLAVADRVLVKNQSSTFQNGIYVVSNVGSGSTNWVMTRATDYDQASEIIQFGVIPVNQGTTNAGLLFQETGAGPFTIGTTPITFAAYTTQAIGTPGAAGTILRSNGSDWIASTSTFADTYGVNTILYAGSANTITGLANTARASLSSNATGVPTWLALTDGQLVIGSSAGAPAAASLTAGAGISITPGSNSITIAAGGVSAWSGVAGTTQAAAVNSGYVIQNAGTTTVTLPATAALGSIVAIAGLGAGGWVLTANTGQTIKIGSATTSSAGSLASVNQYDEIEIVCLVANTTWGTRFVVSAGLTVT